MAQKLYEYRIVEHSDYCFELCQGLNRIKVYSCDAKHLMRLNHIKKVALTKKLPMMQVLMNAKKVGLAIL